MSHKKNTQSKAQQKTYYELLSLMLLKRKFPDIYSDLEYVGGNHTPDLETPNHSIGVEVTCAFKKEHMERQAFFDEYAGKKYSAIPTKVHERLYKCGKVFGNNNETASMLIDNGFYDSRLNNDEQENRVKECISKKIEKLNSNISYSKNESQELFIFLQENLPFKVIEKIYKFVCHLQLEKSGFNKIYISSKDYSSFYRLYELNPRALDSMLRGPCEHDTTDIIASCRKLVIERLNKNG